MAEGRAIATGAVRLVSRPEPPPAAAAEAIRAAAAAVRAIDPTAAREKAEAARVAALRLLDQDASLGSSVVAHSVTAVAAHARLAADAREEDTRLQAEMRGRFRRYGRRRATPRAGSEASEREPRLDKPNTRS